MRRLSQWVFKVAQREEISLHIVSVGFQGNFVRVGLDEPLLKPLSQRDDTLDFKVSKPPGQSHLLSLEFRFPSHAPLDAHYELTLTGSHGGSFMRLVSKTRTKQRIDIVFRIETDSGVSPQRPLKDFEFGLTRVSGGSGELDVTDDPANWGHHRASRPISAPAKREDSGHGDGKSGEPASRPTETGTVDIDKILATVHHAGRADSDAARLTAVAEAEAVDAAVFCPPRVARESVFMVQVFLYPPGAEAAVEGQAVRADPTAEHRGVYSFPLDVPRGTRVDLHLETPTLAVAEPNAVIVWRGRPTATQFEVGVPAIAKGPNAIARVRFAIDGVPAGTLRFQVALTAAGSSAERAIPHELEAVRYRRAFASYASPDRPEVLRRVQAFKIAGMSVFQDVLDLDPGERWERALYREIDACDVFLLFWSRAAAASEWVTKEIDYALARKAGDQDRPPAIQPVPIEGPPMVPPPEQLKDLHFNDALLALISTSTRAGPGSPPGSG